MKKFNAFIFIFCYLLMTKVVFGAKITLEGKSVECEQKEYNAWECLEGNKKSIMVMTENGYGVISESSPGVVTIRPVSKIIENYQIIHESAVKYPPFEDSKFNRAEAAYAAKEILSTSKNPVAKELFKIAEKYLGKIEEVGANVKIKLGDGNSDYTCKRGETRAYTPEEIKMQKEYKTKFECAFFSCKGKDPKESVLAMIPKIGSTMTPATVMVMKDGQAKLHEGNFKIYDNSPLMLASINKTDFYGSDEGSAVNPDLFIPKKYDQSKSSFIYLNDLSKNNFQDTDGLMDLCSGKEIKKLFAEQKKIGEAVVNHLSEADLIEFLKLIDGRIQSHYIDRSKGLTLGCMYQGKIIDSSVMNQFPRLEQISNVKPNDKYLTPNEVQELYKKAVAMKDIPFGYKYDGCYARAHLMSRRFEEMGIATKKVWIKGKLFVPGTDIEWDYHVAPVVEVKEKNGKIQQYVIDPSLNSKAVTVDEWVASMGRKTKGPIMKTTYPMPANPVDFQRTTVGISSSDLFAPGDTPNLTEELKMKHVSEKLQKFREVLASQGK